MPHSTCVLAIAAFLPLSLARADQVTVGSTRDNTLYAESGSVSNGAGDHVFAGTSGVGDMRRALFAFDVATYIPAGSTITSVHLVLTMTMTSSGPATIELHKVTAAWGEGTSNAGGGSGAGAPATANDATWTDRYFATPFTWATPGGDYATAASGSTIVDQLSAYTFGSSAGLVADVQNWLDVPGGAQGWILINTDLVSIPSAKRFSSRTNPSVADRPRLVIDYTPPLPTGYCFGDGSGTACPCANAGISGNGCGNSIFPGGAHLAVTGTPSIAADSLTLVGTAMPDSSVLYFQGSAQQTAGLGAVFGDGLRCATGIVIRLGTKLNASGTSQYPAGGDPSISVKGMLTLAPVTRDYQCWYRNAAVFCTASTFNLSNGVQVVWSP